MSVETMYIGRCYKCRRALSALIVKIEAYEVTTQGKGAAAGQTFTRTRRRALTASGTELRVMPSTVAHPYNSVEVNCPCGSSATCQPVRGKVSHHECGPKCVNATGHNCECQCGGKNHGRGYAFAA